MDRRRARDRRSGPCRRHRIIGAPDHTTSDATGQPGHRAWTLIFGNPAAGAKLLALDLAAAVDIPLRLAVIARDDASEVVWRDMRSLLADAALADAFTSALRTLATAAGDRSTQRRA